MQPKLGRLTRILCFPKRSDVDSRHNLLGRAETTSAHRRGESVSCQRSPRPSGRRLDRSRQRRSQDHAETVDAARFTNRGCICLWREMAAVTAASTDLEPRVSGAYASEPLPVAVLSRACRKCVIFSVCWEDCVFIRRDANLGWMRSPAGSSNSYGRRSWSFVVFTGK